MRKLFRTIARGFVSGAADDDPSAIGTYASAGAKFGLSILWTAPVTFPMMVTVVYLSSKLGQVSGKGLFEVLKDHYPRWLLYPTLIGVLIGNTIEAGADLGGIAAALSLFVPLPPAIFIPLIAASILIVQVFASYGVIRSVLSWLALSLVAYIFAALMAKPDLIPVLKGTFIPKVEFTRDFLMMLVAIIGTTMSAYLFTWQSNQEKEEEIAKGRTSLAARRGASEAELKETRIDITAGMFFSNVVMYFIILATASTLYKAGQHDVSSAADAAQALRPLAGDAAGYLFALGIVAVGLLAVPVMTTGAAYDLAQVMGWPSSLHATPSTAPKFYMCIAAFTLIAVGINFLGFNPMKALVFAGVVQGFSTPPLLCLMMLMTNDRAIMGDKVNSRLLSIAGWLSTLLVGAASAGLLISLVI